MTRTRLALGVLVAVAVLAFQAWRTRGGGAPPATPGARSSAAEPSAPATERAPAVGRGAPALDGRSDEERARPSLRDAVAPAAAALRDPGFDAASSGDETDSEADDAAPPSSATERDATPGDGSEHAASYLDLLTEFENETRDPSWAVAAETSVLTALGQQTGLALASSQVECRASLCKVELLSPKGASQRPAMLGRIDGLEAMIGVAHQTPDGSPLMVILLARDAFVPR